MGVASRKKHARLSDLLGVHIMSTNLVYQAGFFAEPGPGFEWGTVTK